MTVRSQMSLLRGNRNFRRVWYSQVVGMLGASLMTVAAGLAVLQHGGGVTTVSLILAARAAGLFSGYLTLGALTAHCSLRTLMVTADALRVVTTAAVGVGILRGDVAMMSVAVLVTGLAESVFNPAARALVPRVVAEEDLVVANSVSAVTRSSMTIAGPGLGGTMLLVLDPLWVVFVNSVCFALSAALLAGVPAVASVSARGTVTPRRYARSLAGGARALRRTTWLWRYAISGALQMSLGVGAWTVLGPVVARLTWNPSAFATILFVYALGGLLGGFLAPRVARGRTAVRASFAVALFGLALLGLTQSSFVVCLICCAVAGAGIELGTVLFDSLVQQEIDADFLGRVSALLMLPSTFVLPLSYLIVGAVSEDVGPLPVLVVAAVGAVLAMSLLAVQEPIRRLELTDADTHPSVGADHDR